MDCGGPDHIEVLIRLVSLQPHPMLSLVILMYSGTSLIRNAGYVPVTEVKTHRDWNACTEYRGTELLIRFHCITQDGGEHRQTVSFVTLTMVMLPRLLNFAFLAFSCSQNTW